MWSAAAAAAVCVLLLLYVCLLWLQLVSPGYDDLITPLKAITEQPFWIPSQSLQLKMVTHAHTVIEVLNQVHVWWWGGGGGDTLLHVCV